MMIGAISRGSLVRHVIESIASRGICLHLQVLAGRIPSYCEAEFKELARALRFAIEPDPHLDGIPSTKRCSVMKRRSWNPDISTPVNVHFRRAGSRHGGFEREFSEAEAAKQRESQAEKTDDDQRCRRRAECGTILPQFEDELQKVCRQSVRRRR